MQIPSNLNIITLQPRTAGPFGKACTMFISFIQSVRLRVRHGRDSTRVRSPKNFFQYYYFPVFFIISNIMSE